MILGIKDFPAPGFPLGSLSSGNGKVVESRVLERVLAASTI